MDFVSAHPIHKSQKIFAWISVETDTSWTIYMNVMTETTLMAMDALLFVKSKPAIVAKTAARLILPNVHL